MGKIWGWHARLDGIGCKDKVSDPENVKNFAKALVKAIDMVPYGEPQVVHFGPTPELQGLTLVQLIETSNICAHFCDLDGGIFLDIFSCKDFDMEDVFPIVEEYFDTAPHKYRWDFTKRYSTK